jgi:hypothetical protein
MSLAPPGTLEPGRPMARASTVSNDPMGTSGSWR